MTRPPRPSRCRFSRRSTCTVVPLPTRPPSAPSRAARGSARSLSPAARCINALRGSFGRECYEPSHPPSATNEAIRPALRACSPRLRSCPLSAPLPQAAAQLLGCRSVRLYQSSVFYKRPGHGETCRPPATLPSIPPLNDTASIVAAGAAPRGDPTRSGVTAASCRARAAALGPMESRLFAG